jgi:hypothetical protein
VGGQFDRPVTSSRDVSLILDDFSRAIVNQLRRPWIALVDTSRSIPTSTCGSHRQRRTFLRSGGHAPQSLDRDATFASHAARMSAGLPVASSLSFDKTLATMRTSAASDRTRSAARGSRDGWVQHDLAGQLTPFRRAMQLDPAPRRLQPNAIAHRACWET